MPTKQETFAKKPRPHWSRKLEKAGACDDAVAWAKTQPSASVAWKKCHRGDWMLWIAGKHAGAPGSDARRPLTLAACECARLALRFVRKGDERPRVAIKKAEQWARGVSKVTIASVRSAAAAAYAAADAASAAAYAAADAASAAAYAAAAADADGYAYADARQRVLAQCAEIVRKHYPRPPKDTQ